MLQQLPERMVAQSPEGARNYLILMRLHKPTGVWLYLLPGLWAFALASGRRPDLPAVLWLAVAAVLVRGATCAANDVVDRDIDAQVARTKARPVAAGRISVGRALLFATVLAVASLAVLALINAPTALVVGVSYPFLVVYAYMKRIFWWPTAWLALVINVYAIAGWTAATGRIEFPPAVVGLFACGFFWTLVHDTVYSHQDKQYDRAIGVKSSALMLGTATKAWLGLFIVLAVAGALWAGFAVHSGWAYFLIVVLAGLLLAYQVVRVDLDDPKSCWDTFVANRWFGWIILAAAIAGHFS